MINRTLVIIFLFLLLLYIINDLDDKYEMEGCHWAPSTAEGRRRGCRRRRPRPPPRPPALPNDRAVGYRWAR